MVIRIRPSILELKIPLTNISPPLNPLDKIPNRIAILSWVHQDGFTMPLDYCREESSFLTFAPDNNGDDIPDGMRLAPTILNLTKTFEITKDGNPSLPYPGTLVTFSIYYTNISGSCVDVKIKDTLQPGFTYVPGSLRHGNSTNSYNTSMIYTDNLDDDLACFQLPDKIIFVPYNGSAPSIGGYLSPNASGRCFFRAIINNLPDGTALSNISFATGSIFPVTNSNKVVITIVSTNAPHLSIMKSISNIKYLGVISSPVPGASVTYKIQYNNNGNTSATNAIIIDGINDDFKYISNSVQSSPGWLAEFSTNQTPDQSLSSSHYSPIEPSPENVKWIRWKKSSVLVNETGLMIFRVIIK